MSAGQKDFARALVAFTDAAANLDEVWQGGDIDAQAQGYPSCLPSFDEFVAQLYAWRAAQEGGAA